MSTPSVAATPVATAWQRRVKAVPRGLWGVADQGVVSLANFATPVLIGRYGGQEELGLYTLGLSVYLFVYAMARSLVWTPYTKHAPAIDANDLPSYTGSVSFHLAAYGAVSAAAILGAAGIALAAGQTQLAAVLAVVAPVSAAMLLREHVRRLGMAKLDFVGVLVFDLVVAALQLSAMLSLAASGMMSADRAFLALAVTSLASFGWIALNHREFCFKRENWTPDWRKNWSLSKWLAAAACLVTLGNQGYRWVLPALAGIAELGRLGAAQVMAQLTNPVVIGLSNYLAPVTAKVLAEEGLVALYRTTLRVTLSMLVGIVLFLLLVGLVGVPLVELLLADAARGVTTTLLVTLTAGALSEALLIPVQAATVNRGHSHTIFYTALARLAINLTLGFGLVGIYGAEAIGVGMVIGSAIALAWQWIEFTGEVRRA
ncbi:lipopolysaccharide biosynthesis protein [Botrimarina hoheduenensis]|uniref:MurJ-like flippase n=1 Tax=Botrimarina hoheduenensis TaxID=2528000 RepID=A0A5C5WDF2_9BACT|nr:hypothetical protein [Botrimarina hoheduenensis]TWT48714.1 MurJ-like flippase [Botrimarina hoheduenensis]